MNKSFAYYRVSTDRQGQSGLGLEAQQKSVQDFAKSNNLEVIKEFVEIESGRKIKRPVLKEALKECKKQNAVLLIAKIDRLGRNVAFISSLIEAKVDFIAIDNPFANKLVVHIMAAFAEHERDQISQRTRDALQAAKRKGRILGRYGREVLSVLNKRSADAFALKMLPVFEQLEQGGHRTIRSLTSELNRQNIKTFSGGTARWHIHTVYCITKRMKKLRSDTALNP